MYKLKTYICKSIGHEFDTHPTRVEGETIGHWINQHSPCVPRHGLTASHGSLSLAM